MAPLVKGRSDRALIHVFTQGHSASPGVTRPQARSRKVTRPHWGYTQDKHTQQVEAADDSYIFLRQIRWRLCICISFLEISPTSPLHDRLYLVVDNILQRFEVCQIVSVSISHAGKCPEPGMSLIGPTGRLKVACLPYRMQL